MKYGKVSCFCVSLAALVLRSAEIGVGQAALSCVECAGSVTCPGATRAIVVSRLGD